MPHPQEAKRLVTQLLMILVRSRDGLLEVFNDDTLFRSPCTASPMPAAQLSSSVNSTRAQKKSPPSYATSSVAMANRGKATPPPVCDRAVADELLTQRRTDQESNVTTDSFSGIRIKYEHAYIHTSRLTLSHPHTMSVGTKYEHTHITPYPSLTHIPSPCL